MRHSKYTDDLFFRHAIVKLFLLLSRYSGKCLICNGCHPSTANQEKKQQPPRSQTQLCTGAHRKFLKQLQRTAGVVDFDPNHPQGDLGWLL